MFLVAVIATAEKRKETFQQILELRNQVERKVMCMGRRAKAGHELLRLLYRQPLVNVNTVKKELRLSHVASATLLRTFTEKRLLKEVTGFKRNRLYGFKAYMELFTK